jgi:futalosine hydrolase
VVEVSRETFGDTGAETATGSYIDIHEMELIPPDVPPFLGGELISPHAGATGLPLVKGLSVNKVHGYLPSITEMMIHYDADIETMEGAAFFYACLSAGQPFVQIRSLSNYVEPRDRSKWNIPLAVETLNAKLIELIQEAKP